MRLRPYQNDLVEEVRQAYRDGYRSPCIVLGCGGGKSCITAEMARRTTQNGNRVLFLVHRQELCSQIRETFRAWGVDMRLCSVMMVQTAARRLCKIQEPKLIITDENHHCLANSYRKIYNAFPKAWRLGVTATPVRLNGGGLGDINDILIIGKSTKWLIEHQFLAPYAYFAPSVADLTGLHVKRGEYDAKEVEQRLKKQAIYGDVVQHYQSLCKGRQAICYCASISHSVEMALQFTKSGIPAAHIDGTMLTQDRRKRIEQFRNGEIRILCNVDLISEGFDVPDCGACILLRPTKSLTLYIQQSMRCMRYRPGKKAVIIDHVGNYARFGLPDADRSWSLDTKRRKKEENHVKVRQCPECFFTFEPSAICPNCGYLFPIKERELEEIKEKKLELIQGFTLDYTTPEECGTMAELRAYAKKKGYKPGWAYYYGRQRGIV